MRSKKDNEKYIEEERIKKVKLIELYKQQDQKLIDEMSKSFDIRLMLLVGIIVYGIILLGFFTYINLKDITW